MAKTKLMPIGNGLDIERAVFTSGASRVGYMRSIGADLFLSVNEEDVRRTLQAGFAAALILPGARKGQHEDQLRIAFDGDAVLFSDESERVYKEQGLDAFHESEAASAHTPLAGGPILGPD